MRPLLIDKTLDLVRLASCLNRLANGLVTFNFRLICLILRCERTFLGK